MIFTLTMNPCLDSYVYVDTFAPEEINRVREVKDYAGGKGINVSRAIREVGGDSVALCLLGGTTGDRVSRMLAESGIVHTTVSAQAESRTNLHFCLPNGEMIKVNFPGPEVPPDRAREVFRAITSMTRPGDTVVVSGTVPKGIPSGFYREVILALEKNEVRVFLDAEGATLLAGLSAAPFAVKPNLKELSGLVGANLDGADALAVLRHAREIRERYSVKEVVVSLGERGALAFDGQWAVSATVPKVNVLSTVGAGDAFLAGYVLRRSLGENMAEALRFASACGTATVTMPGSVLCKAEDVRALISRITILELRRAA